MKANRIDHLVIAVKDLDAAMATYTETLSPRATHGVLLQLLER
jgi:catechol 2,3-dioxygenase-like lactoylglutathione lyase family enzyme